MTTKINLPECKHPHPFLCDCHILTYLKAFEVGDYVRDMYLPDPTHGIVTEVTAKTITIDWDHDLGPSTTSRTGRFVRYRPCTYEG